VSRIEKNLLALATFALTLAATGAAAADAPHVLLVRPQGAAPEVSTALIRVQGELVADGFEVDSREAAPGASSEAAMNQAEVNSTWTTVGLFLSADGNDAELWVVDRLTNKTVVRRVATRGDSERPSSEALAISTVELLRASLLELTVERNALASRASRPAVQHASEWAARPLMSPAPRWGIEIGAAAIWNPTQIDAAFESVARGRFAATPALQLRLSFMGLGTRPRVRGTGGSALVQEWSGLAEGLFTPFSKWVARPYLTLGVGTLHTSVDGDAAWPYRAVQTSQWAFAGDAGLGVAWRLAPRLELSFEGHTLWATPEPIVRFVDQDGPHVGRPTVAGSLTLVGWL